MPRDGRAVSDIASCSGSVTQPDLEAGLEMTDMVSSVNGAGAQIESTPPPAVDRPRHPEQQPVRIPRVRRLLRLADCDVFTPQVVRIGPYNVGADSYLFQSAGEKEKAVKDIIEKQGVDPDGLEAAVKKLADEVRPCYTHLPEDSMDSEKFSSMLLHDGCYLLCRFIDFGDGANSSNGGGGSGGSGSCGGDVGNNNTLVRDILYLLENQIPLSVLEAILNYIKRTENRHHAPQYIYSGVQHVLQQELYVSMNRQPEPATPSDLLHLVYSYFRRRPDEVPPGSAPGRRLKGTGRWRRATEYCKYANLRFRPREFQDGQQWSILDIDIKEGTLCIPFLQVSIGTWTLLRNLMALEEQERERPVTAYCVFMSQLACTAEDVQLLQGAGIIQHFMPNDKKAAKGFANLCRGVAMDIDCSDRNYLKPVWHDLHKRCSNKVHNFNGFFHDKYCSTVFYRLVFIVAILVFVAQLTQATYAVIAYHKPPR